MKKILITLLLITVAFGHELFAQVEITPYGGWLWTGRIPAWRQDIKISDEGNYGIRVGVTAREQMVVEFEWNHTENTSTFFEYNLDGSLGDLQNVPLTLNYYMLGFVYETTYNEALIPFGIINLGILNAKLGAYSNYGSVSNNYFAAGFGGGLKYFFTDNFGIRLQARLLVPMQFGGIGFGCGIGTGGAGCGAGVSTYSSIIQGDFTGAVVLKLGN